MKDEDLILYPNKIYTSYFAVVNRWAPRSIQVNIAAKCPDDFSGIQCEWLKPPPDLLWAYKAGEVTDGLYIDVYTDTVLSTLDPSKVYEILKGKVMCCWERPEKLCHRHIFLEWIRSNLGNQIIGGELSFLLKKAAIE